jgi:hypothetical protein
MMPRVLLVLFLSIFILAGCANLTSIHREINVNDGTGVLIDIKQRGVFVVKKTTPRGEVIICAEPSPDALSAYAAEFAAKGEVPSSVAVEIAGKIQENAAFTGLRTQSIQLLRDSLYRLCEAYMNGAIDKNQYDLLIRRYQKQTVALLAIEQLTGTLRVPLVTINMQKNSEATPDQKKLEDKEKEMKEAEAPKASASEAEKKKREGKTVALKTKKAGIKNKPSQEDQAAPSSLPAEADTVSQNREQNIYFVANAVQKIVKSITTTDDFGQICLNLLQKENSNLTKSENKLHEICLASFKKDIDVLTQGEITRIIIKKVMESNLPESKKIEFLEKIMKKAPIKHVETKSLPNGTIKGSY